MRWSDYLLLAAAVVTALATVATAFISWQMGRYRLRVRVRVERAQQGALALHVELINTGAVTVTVEEVFLARRRHDAPAFNNRLRDERGYPKMPVQVQPGRKVTIGPVHAATLQAVGKRQLLTVVAKTEDGSVVKARSRRLREFHDQVHPAPGERPKP